MTVVPFSERKVTNLPLTKSSPLELDITVWRGCDALITLPIQHEFLMEMGLDYAEAAWEPDVVRGITDEQSKVKYFRIINWLNLYGLARMQIRNSWVKQGSVAIPALADLQAPVTYCFAPDTYKKSPIPREVHGQFAAGLHREACFFLFIPFVMTQEFDFNSGVYGLEFVALEKDALGNEIVNKILRGKVTVLGEKI